MFPHRKCAGTSYSIVRVRAIIYYYFIIILDDGLDYIILLCPSSSINNNKTLHSSRLACVLVLECFYYSIIILDAVTNFSILQKRPLKRLHRIATSLQDLRAA